MAPFMRHTPAFPSHRTGGRAREVREPSTGPAKPRKGLAGIGRGATFGGLARRTGIEPATYGFGDRRSTD